MDVEIIDWTLKPVRWGVAIVWYNFQAEWHGAGGAEHPPVHHIPKILFFGAVEEGHIFTGQPMHDSAELVDQGENSPSLEVFVFSFNQL